MIDFKQVLNTKAADIERPKLPPIGWYNFRVMKLPEARTINDQWDSIDFVCRAYEAVEVDADELEKYGDVKNAVVRHSFMINKQDDTAAERTLFELKRFLTEHIGCMTEDQSVREGLNASVNQAFAGYVNWKQDKQDGEVFHPNMSKTMAVK